MPEHDKSDAVESIKFVADYLKHLTTLSTGSLLLISTFLEKFFARPLWKPCVIVALSSFLVSVIGAALALTALAAMIEDPLDYFSDSGLAFGFGLIATWAGFLVGIISFAAFAIKNLIQFSN
ncbi:MAG: hypothetical protein WCD12_08615 [Candidatus Binatus sp.]|jgi:hypothetical protein|uniref:hypothetical protein n=1 Tax=Candidatus Binatus sp. TaxID=2811406 RepID=UPI003C7641F8